MKFCVRNWIWPNKHMVKGGFMALNFQEAYSIISTENICMLLKAGKECGNYKYIRAKEVRCKNGKQILF